MNGGFVFRFLFLVSTFVLAFLAFSKAQDAEEGMHARL
jgi:hypothetical protein